MSGPTFSRSVRVDTGPAIVGRTVQAPGLSPSDVVRNINGVTGIRWVTQAEYDALDPVATVLYLLTA